MPHPETVALLERLADLRKRAEAAAETPNPRLDQAIAELDQLAGRRVTPDASNFLDELLPLLDLLYKQTMGAPAASPGRQGLDRLLGERPDSEVIRIETSLPWICVDLGESPSGDTTYEPRHTTALPLERWAIWRNTGNVYRVGEYGAVEDDPEFVITPLEPLEPA